MNAACATGGGAATGGVSFVQTGRGLTDLTRWHHDFEAEGPR
jgi:hypothetical protein